MIDATSLGRADDLLSARHAFKAAQAFLESWWKRGGENSDEIATILGSMELDGGGIPLDPALWNDWLDAIDRTT